MHGFLFSSKFNHPYYEGGGSSVDAPFVAEVALGGHAYMIDWSAEVPLRHVSIPVLRQQQDTSDSPGEQSVNSEGLWRRFGETWHTGAGQERYDRKESNRFRFNHSQGVNVWDKWKLSLLHDVVGLDLDAGATNQQLSVAGDYLYYSQGVGLFYYPTLAGALVSVTGLPATAVLSMASNGFRIWTAHAANGIYMTQRGTASSASHITGSVALVGYVKNRVLAANGPDLYDVTALAVGVGGALPASFFTHNNPDWDWVGFAESQGFIYAAGRSGDKSLIYSIGITTDGTSLSSPIVAGALPDGEIVTGLYGYLGRFLAVGSNKGFRLALVSEDGGLTIGALIETPKPVLCFEGQGPHIWYGLADFDAITSINASGLGRMATDSFSDVDNFVPAYASDLMVSEQTGQVTSIVTFENRKVFAVDNGGIYIEHATEYVQTAALDTGKISYGMTEAKTALFIDLQIDQRNTTASPIQVLMSVDGGNFLSLGTYDSDNMQTFNAGEAVGNEFELRLVFGADNVDPTIAVNLLSWLLRSQPRPEVSNLIFVTILLVPVVESLVDGILDYDTNSELEYIEQLNREKSVVTFQRNNQLYSVIVEDYEINIKELLNEPDGMTGFNSSCTTKLKRI